MSATTIDKDCEARAAKSASFQQPSCIWKLTEVLCCNILETSGSHRTCTENDLASSRVE